MQSEELLGIVENLKILSLAIIVVSLSIALPAGVVPVFADAGHVYWDITGVWSLDFDYLGGHYIHTMTVTTEDFATGFFSGTGVYNPDNSYTWTVTGLVSCNTIAFQIIYTGTGAGYTVTATGTIASDGLSMSGDWSSNAAQTGTWIGTGTAGPYVSGPPFGSFVNAGCVPTDATLVLNITHKVTNDEDSGNVGYWALDNYNKHVQVWQLPDGTFYVVARYAGKWQTFAGALSPGSGALESKDAFGTFEGGYVATFTATGFTSAFGNIGTFDYGGTKADVLLGTYGASQTGPTTPFSFLSTYFTAASAFTYVNWGWTYHYRSQTWLNYASGTTGDIVV